jgi:hypothetical protein
LILNKGLKAKRLDLMRYVCFSPDKRIPIMDFGHGKADGPESALSGRFYFVIGGNIASLSQFSGILMAQVRFLQS